jgi:Uma2 family endonuclease
MPTVVTERPYRTVNAEPLRKRWTRAECDGLEKWAGWDSQHLELIEGELIAKVPKNRPHANGLIVLQGWLIQIFGVQFVNPEVPIDVSPEDTPTSRPEPDLIVLSTASNQITDRCPRANELRLVVEVSDSTVGFDLTTKAALYARAQIVEYWVADIPAKRLVVHRKPENGLYKEVALYAAPETVAPLAAPNSEFEIATLFPA